MKFFKTVSLEEALKIIENKNQIVLEKEKIRIDKCLGRVLAETIFSSIDLPSYNRSTVDGYAINVKDTFGASETFPSPLTLTGEIKMGEISNSFVNSGECIYVPTGGMVPLGANGVVMIEDCERLESEMLIHRGISQFSNMILCGDEIKKDTLILPEFTKLTPYHIGVLASVGVEYIEVFKKLKFTIISTGDEIVDIGQNLKDGQIYDINTYILKALIEEMGGEVIKTHLVVDNPDLLKSSLENSISKSNLVLISGGSSVGTRDYTRDCIEELGGEVLIHGMNIKPGKPAIISKCQETFVIGLPGHPQSAVNVFKILMDPFFKIKKKFLYGKLSENIFGDPGKATFISVKLIEEENSLIVVPIFSKSSMIRPLMDSDGYIVIPAHREGLYEGESVKVILNE